MHRALTVLIMLATAAFIASPSRAQSDPNDETGPAEPAAPVEEDPPAPTDAPAIVPETPAVETGVPPESVPPEAEVHEAEPQIEPHGEEADGESEALDCEVLEAAGFCWEPQLQIRIRGELRADPYVPGFVDGTVLTRLRAGLTATNDWASALFQLQDARALGLAATGTDSGATTGVHQGYVELRTGDHWLRVGRQEIVWADQRVLGAGNWSMPGRAFDGVRGTLDFGGVSVEALGAIVAWRRTVSQPSPDPTMPALSARSEGDYLAGARGLFEPSEDTDVEAYVLYRHDGPTDAQTATPANGGIQRSRDVATAGVRASGRFDAFAFEAETFVQLGESNGDSHVAFAALGEASYAFDTPVKPTLAIGGTFATGDGDPTDGESNEVDPFFPTAHGPYGIGDWIELRNGATAYAEFGIAPAPYAVSIAAHALFMPEPDGRWITSAFSAVPAAQGSAFLGLELDVLATWKPDPSLTVGAGYAILVPDGAQRFETPEPFDRPAHWAYVELDFKVPP